MNLVEAHIIKSSNFYFKELDTLSFYSKNLYNKANYIIRQEFTSNKVWIRYKELYEILKPSVEYKSLPASCSQQILRLLDKNWTSFFNSCKEYKKNPKKFLGRPKLPKYLDKQKGRFILSFPFQAIDKTEFNKTGLIRLPKSQIKIKTLKTNEKIVQVRVIPRIKSYKVEIVYEKECKKNKDKSEKIIAIDLGVNNLMSITSNLKGFSPLLINGRHLKSINQYYNKKLAFLKSEAKKKNSLNTTKRIQKLHQKRTNILDWQLHNISKKVLDICLNNNIDTIVIGKNKHWKQEVCLGKSNNQNFIQIPYNSLIQKLKYKSELEGIKVLLISENYTSKCSFLDKEEICKHEKYLGKRVKRGLFKSSTSKLINADINASYNILRKEFPDSFEKGIRGCVIQPLKLKFHKPF